MYLLMLTRYPPLCAQSKYPQFTSHPRLHSQSVHAAYQIQGKGIYGVCCHQFKLSLANVLLQVISPKCVTITKPVYMQSLAEQFYSTYNGCRYNSLEKTVCQLVYVSWLEILKSSQGAALASPGLTELPSCPVCLERLVCEEGKWEEGQGGMECEGGGGRLKYSM